MTLVNLVFISNVTYELMPKVLVCAHCSRRLVTSTYGMWHHIQFSCKAKADVGQDQREIREKGSHKTIHKQTGKEKQYT